MNTQKAQPNALEDIKVSLKLKLAMLWMSFMFLYIYVDYFHLYMPGKLEDLLKGRVVNNITKKTVKEYGFMYDEGFLPARKPNQRTLIYNTEFSKKGKISKIDFIRVFKDHELDGVYKSTYDRKGRHVKEEFGPNETSFTSITTYRYKVENL